LGQLERGLSIPSDGGRRAPVDVPCADGGSRPATSKPVEEDWRGAAAPESFLRLFALSLPVPGKWIECLAHGLPSPPFLCLLAAIIGSSSRGAASLSGSSSTSGPTFLAGAAITMTSSLLPPAVKSIRMLKRSAVGVAASDPIAAV